MNCEKCQELVSNLLDGTISSKDRALLDAHLETCLDCAEVRSDLESIVLFCRNHRGEYSAPPDQRALWLRIRNIVEADQYAGAAVAPGPPQSNRSWAGWMDRTWQLSLPQMVSSVAAIVVLVSLATAVGMRQFQSSPTPGSLTESSLVDASAVANTNVRDRMWQQQQSITYWNQRVEMNKVRWSPEMRETFDRNLMVIDQAVNDSINELTINPHDEVSEEMLNAALHEKLSLLKEFGEL